MRRMTACLLVAFLVAVLLSGCWDMRMVQDIHYVTAIGIDYNRDAFTVYTQMLDFSTVAKQEAGKAQQEISVWLGQGSGASLDMAINDLYNSAQQQISLGHTTVIVLTERAIKNGLPKLLDALARYREFRYTQWMFCTMHDMQEILTATPQFNLSPLQSMLHKPTEMHKLHSKIPPISLKDFLIRYREPAETVLVPTLKMNHKSWHVGPKPHPMLQFDGAMAFHDSAYLGHLSDKELQGFRWTSNETSRSPVMIKDDSGKLQAVLSVEKVDARPRVTEEHGKPFVRYLIKAMAYAGEQMGGLDESELSAKVRRKIEEEVRSTFANGLKRGVDVMGLEGRVYRQKNELWKKTFRDGKAKVNAQMLGAVDVEIILAHSGKLKLQP